MFIEVELLLESPAQQLKPKAKLDTNFDCF